MFVVILEENSGKGRELLKNKNDEPTFDSLDEARGDAEYVLRGLEGARARVYELELQDTLTPERDLRLPQPIPIKDIVAALEREALNTSTDPRWLAAERLKQVTNWKTRTLMCRIDDRPAEVVTKAPPPLSVESHERSGVMCPGFIDPQDREVFDVVEHGLAAGALVRASDDDPQQ